MDNKKYRFLALTQEDNTDYAVIIRKDTQEVIGEVKINEGIHGIRVITKEEHERKKYFVDEHKMSTRHTINSFAKINLNAFADLSKLKLTSAEFSVLFLCISKINYTTNTAKKHSRKFLSASDICEELELNQKTVDNALKKLELLELFELEENKIIINPYFTHKGYKIKEDILNLFFDSKWNDSKN